MAKTHLEEISEFESQRAEALLRGDVSSYVSACNELGIEPEDEVVGDYVCEDKPRIQKDSVRVSKNHTSQDKISYKIKGYKRAQEIISGFGNSSNYLRSLVANVTGNGEFADSLDYMGLKREGFKIRGVARKILRSKK
jgi:hypothetical protein